MLLLARPSFSPCTVFQIRFAHQLKKESQAQMIQRLARIYGLSEMEIKLLIAASNEHVDCFGRYIE